MSKVLRLGTLLGRILEHIGGVLGHLEAISGVFGRSWTVWDHVELSWKPLGALLERSWGRLRGSLGPSSAPLEPCGGLRG
eukprot:69429-Pyramimonas_sp.AAC.1